MLQALQSEQIQSDRGNAVAAINSQAVASSVVRYFSLAEGDAIRITFFPDSAFFLNGIYPIDNQGNIFLPLFGRTNISSMNENEIVDFLNKAFINQLRYPSAQIRPLIRLSFVGGFHHPGLYYVDPSVSLWDAVKTTGGPMREDGLRLMNWERHGQIIDERLDFSIESGKSLQELGFKSGDEIWVTVHPKKYYWEKFNSEVLPGLTFLVTSVTASLAVYTTFRLLNK